MRSPHRCLVLFIAGALAGCANIHARKVPVEERIAGADREKGFRYYLPRPYVVVAKQVLIATEVEEAEVVQLKNKATGAKELGLRSQLCIPGQPGKPRIYDRSGKPLNPDEWLLDHAYVAQPAKLRTPIPPAAPDAKGKSAIPAEPRFGPAPPPASGGASGDDIPGLQVVMLPDFEEQMAVRNKTIAAKSAYDLHFTDGWQLESVNGAWNSTEVPIRLLQSITKVIKAAEALQLQAIGTAPKGPSPPPFTGKSNIWNLPAKVFVTRTYYLEPGIYRIQKSWERQPSEVNSVAAAAGLLSDLGLEIGQNVEINLANGQ